MTVPGPPLSTALPALLLAAGGLFSGCGAPPEPRGLVAYVPRPYFHDFGNVENGTRPSHVFHMRNEGETPIVVKGLIASCSCGSARIFARDVQGQPIEGDPSNPEGLLSIAPGGEAELEVTVDTRYVRVKNQPKHLTVQVKTDSHTTPFLGYEVHVRVDEPFYTVPTPFNLGVVPQNGPGYGTTTILKDPKSTSGLRIADVLETPEDVEVELSHELKFDLDHWNVQATLLPPQAVGMVRRPLRFSTVHADGSAGPPFEIELLAQVAADVEVKPPNLYVRRGAAATGTIEARLPGQRIKVVRSEVLGDYADLFELTLTPEQPGSDGRATLWNFELELTGELDEAQVRGHLLFELDDPQTPRLEVQYDCFSS